MIAKEQKKQSGSKEKVNIMKVIYQIIPWKVKAMSSEARRGEMIAVLLSISPDRKETAGGIQPDI